MRAPNCERGKFYFEIEGSEMDGGNSAVFFSHKITYFTCSCKVLIRKSKSASCTDMKLCGKLAAPRAPGNAEMSFQTGTQTAEGLQLPKT